MPDITLWHRDAWSHLALLPRKDNNEPFETIYTYRVVFDWGDESYFLTVPKGMPTDGASIPNIAKVFYPIWGIHTAATIVHDCLCRFEIGCDKMASDLFESIMTADGVDEATVATFADGTRLGGPRFDNPVDPDGAILSTERFSTP